MKKRVTLLVRLFAAACHLAVLQPALPCRGADAAPASPFDKDDPEIAELRKLDWKAVDFDKLDPRARCTAYFALNRGLQNIGGKADARLELLVDYFDAEKLGDAYAAEKQVEADFKPPPFDDLRKVAAAYLKTTAGASKFGKEFVSTSDDLLGRYLTLYEKTARREYEEGCESRLQVRSMALFLERKGKLEHFKQWAAAERKRRQTEFELQLAADKEAAQQAAKETREQAMAAAAERQRQKEEARAAAQLEASVQQPGTFAPSGVDGNEWWDDSWGYGQGYYYYGNGYRGQVRDKVQDAAQRWRTGRPSQLPSRVGGRRR